MSKHRPVLCSHGKNSLVGRKDTDEEPSKQTLITNYTENQEEETLRDLGAHST